jgi:hypothetical protein
MSKFATTQGVSGLVHFDGYVVNDELASLKIYDQQRILKQMIYTDSTVRAVLRIYKSLLSKAKIELTPKKDENGIISEQAQKQFEFVNSCLSDLEIPFKTSVSSLFSFVWWGWSWHEILYKRRNGWKKDRRQSSKFTDNLIGWRKFDSRAQDTLEKFDFDDEQNVTALVQLDPITANNFTVSREKSIYLKTEPNNNKPNGESVLLGAVKDYLYKAETQKTEQATIRRDVIGLLLMGLPAEYFDPSASAQVKAKKAAYDKMISDIDSGKLAGVTIPNIIDDKGNKQFSVETLGLQGSKTYSSTEVINRYDKAIAMALLADFIFLGHTATGTYELGKGKMTLLFESLEFFLEIVCDELNLAVEKLCVYNNFDTQFLPSFIHGKIQELGLAELTPFIQLLISLGVQFSDEEIDWLKSLAMPKFEDKKK